LNVEDLDKNKEKPASFQHSVFNFKDPLLTGIIKGDDDKEI
jgi:hypothetical protein